MQKFRAMKIKKVLQMIINNGIMKTHLRIIINCEVICLGKSGFEQLMGLHAAPMLAGIKPASLLSFQKSRFADFDKLLADYEPCFNCKGIEICRVSEGEEYVLILFYRREKLAKLLTDKAAREILIREGYGENDTVTECLEFLKLRMKIKKSFPHEVGLFLGYPPEDVAGFIKNKGQGFFYSGYWKVYANPQKTRALFDKYADCTHAFCTKLEQGAHLPELVQAS